MTLGNANATRELGLGHVETPQLANPSTDHGEVNLILFA
jgi:hypothetical protein